MENTWFTWLIIFLVLNLIHFLGTFKLYQKAGKKAWSAAIPFYNVYVWMEILNRPKWWFFIAFLPIVGPLFILAAWYDTALSFNKTYKHGIIAILTCGFYLYYLNYIDTSNYTKLEHRKETVLSAIMYAVIFASTIHIFVTQPFIIPTGSMEKTLLVGDGLFVNKWSYGYRYPQTPIAIPFLQNYIPYTGFKKQESNGAINWEKNPTKNYIDAVRLPYTRIGKTSGPKRNDIVVFNYPQDTLNTAVDRKDPYVKRCIAEPGDILEIKNDIVFINNKKVTYPGDAKIAHSYLINTKAELDINYLKNELGVFLDDPSNIINYQENKYLFLSLTDEEAAKMKQLTGIISINKIIKNTENTTIGNQSISNLTTFPKNKNWFVDQYGPLQIPKKGQVINLTPENIDTYRDIISKYENNTLEEKDGQYIINGRPTNNYTIKQDYYWMMGDNRHNSLDSRFFGFVPEDHIIGSPSITWISLNLNGNLSPRWDRILTIPNTGNPEKTSYWWVLLIIIIGYVAGEKWLKKRNENKNN